MSSHPVRHRMHSSNLGGLGPQVAATLQGGFRKLRFPAELEARYLASNEQERLRILQYGFLGSIPLYCLQLVADHEMVPDCMPLAWVLRLWFHVPVVVLLCLALKKVSSIQREWLCAVLGLICCLSSVLISVGSASALKTEHLATLAPIIAFTVLLGRFWPMLVMCVMVFGIYIAAALYTGRLSSAIGVGNALLIQATMFNMLYGRYLLERSARHSFLTDMQEAEMDEEIQATTEQLAKIAREDALTGLANRRHFTARLQEMFERATCQGEALAILMIDVDHFKAYNDHYGHAQGDECLRGVGQVLLGACAESTAALVARWGGEEFAIILPNASHASASALSQAIVGDMATANMPHEASPVAGHVTLSIGGVVCWPVAQTTLADCLAAADECLYQSKKSGRNRASIREVSAARDASAPSPLMT